MITHTTLTAQHLGDIVVTWQNTFGRHELPWQNDSSPYHVLVSELMLQQTQVATVIPYFERWVTKFPTLRSLANADLDEVMQLWQGLGYYSRARNLHKAAKYTVANHQGVLPDTVKELLKIPGVGPYTAGAIMNFAFNKPAALVDGNIKRLYSRLFCIPEPVNSSSFEKRVWQLAEYFLPTQEPRKFAQGLLDLGALVCKARQPDCQNCPLQRFCGAYNSDRVAEFPHPKPRKNKPTKSAHFVWCVDNQGQLLLQQRPPTGIWSALWCLPETTEAPTNAPSLGGFKHTFSHYHLEASLWLVNYSDIEVAKTNQRWLKFNALADIALPAPIRKLLSQRGKSASNFHPKSLDYVD